MDIYKIGVEIALTNSISGALSAITAQVLGLNSHVKDLEKSFSKVGLVAGAAGVGLLMVSGKLVSAGAELSKQVGQMNIMLDNAKDKSLNAAAAIRAATSIPGTTVSENVSMISHMIPSLANPAEAREMLPRVLKDAIATSRKTGLPIEDIISEGFKAIDLTKQNIDQKTGQFSPDRAQSAFHQMASVLFAGGGNIKMNDILGYARQSATYASLTGDEKEYWSNAFTAMMEMGGSKAGTAEQALGRQLIAGRMSKAAALNLEKLGVLDPKHVQFMGGGAASVDKDGYAGGQLLDQGNFATWFQDVFKPAVDKQHGGKATQKDYIQSLTAGMSKDTAARLAATYILAESQFKRDKELVGTVAKKDLYGETMSTDLGMNIEAMSKSFTSLAQVLGQNLVPAAIAVTQALTSLASFLTQFMADHPAAAQATAYGALAGGLGLTGMSLWKGFSWLRGLGGGAVSSIEAAAAGGAGGGILSSLGKWGSRMAGPMSLTADIATLEATDQDRKDFANFFKKVGGLFGGGRSAMGPLPGYGGPMYGNSGLGGYGAPGGFGGLGKAQNIQVNPQIQATNTINIDGRALASYVTQMVIKSISGLMPHQTGAPMAGTGSYAPALDSGAPAH